jgi:transposase-like protein
VLQKRNTIAEVIRASGISKVTFQRWNEQALAGMEAALGDKSQPSSREAQLEREIEQLEWSLGRITAMADLRGNALGG